MLLEVCQSGLAPNDIIFVSDHSYEKQSKKASVIEKNLLWVRHFNNL
jgi:hypothetical protein